MGPVTTPIRGQCVVYLHRVNLDMHGVELFDDRHSIGCTGSGNVWLPLGAAPMVVVETLNEGQMSYLCYPVMSTYTRDHCLTICRLSSSKEREVLEVRAHPAYSRSEGCVFKPHMFLLVTFIAVWLGETTSYSLWTILCEKSPTR